MPLLKRLQSPGPKRILALDGGGIRGAITLGFLERTEKILRERHKNPTLKLRDYFDLIGGTSTGAIIAAGLAIGMDASEIKSMYLDLGGKIFGKRKWKMWEALFDEKGLEVQLKNVFGDLTLGDNKITTGLCVIAKRADTSSTWSFINHPNGQFYEMNKSILLRDVIRASAAAPTYFIPTKFDVGFGQEAAFVDGGVSMANNPALQFLLVATLKGFPFHWKTGEKKLMVVSIGTGFSNQKTNVDDITDDKVWNWASKVPNMLMNDATWQNQLLLQFLSNSPTPWEIDMETGNLSNDLLTKEPVLHYLRYNALLSQNSLNEMGLSRLANKVNSLVEMSAAENRFDLAEIGEKAAEIQIKNEHFPMAFDLSAKPLIE